MIKTALQFLVVLLAVLGGIFLWEKAKTFSIFQVKDIQTTHNLVLEKMTTMGKVELSKFSFRDVVEQELVRDFLPNPKALLIVQGEAVGCIDLTKITKENLSTKNDTLIIQLPDPELCSFKIDHSRSRIFQTEYAFMNEQLLLDEAYKCAEAQIAESALEAGILDQTQENAELVLKPLFETISGKKVLLRFRIKAKIKEPR